MVHRIGLGLAVFLALSFTLSYAQDAIVFQDAFVIPHSHIRSDRTFSAVNSGAGLLTVTKHYTGELLKQGFLRLNGKHISLQDFLRSQDQIFRKEITLESANCLTVSLTGSAGASLSVMITSSGGPSLPPTVSLSAYPSSVMPGSPSTLTWTSTNAHSAYIDNGVGVVAVNGSINVAPSSSTVYTISVSGAAGSASAQVAVQVLGNVSLPPAGSFGASYADLIPADVSVSSYDAKRFSIVTGLVRDMWGAPLADVSVTFLDRPEYGTVKTDPMGRFVLPVDGGGAITLVYRRQGLFPVQRQVDVPWNGFAVAGTIQMIARDAKTTSFTFNGNPEKVAVHQGTRIADEFGSRSASIVLTGDNQAYLTDKDGNAIRPLGTITVRATEYMTQNSMPAVLPPNSAYTYCIELSIDGADRVRFDKPVTVWVENFLGFDAGSVIPVGYYDRDRGLWVPSENGRVVRLLDTDGDGIVDAIDAAGNGQPTDLNGNGSFSDEAAGLTDSVQYPPGATFWRFVVTHMTPWDCNWPYGPPPGAISPNPEGAPNADEAQYKDRGCNGSPGNCYVEERGRILHEDVPLPGTDMTLHYASDVAEGYKISFAVPASGGAVPACLKHIVVKVEVAGRTLERILPPLPDQHAEIPWDGLDSLGRRIEMPAIAEASIGFVYDAYYYQPADFGNAFGQAGADLTTIRARQEVVSWRRHSIHIFQAKGTIAEGWTLSGHHYLSPVNNSIIRKGDGVLIRNNAFIINTIAGNGVSGFSGDGGPATEARFSTPVGLAFDAAGNLYIADYYNFRVRKVDVNGVITTVAGNGNWVYSGDSGPAVDAQLSPLSVAVDSAGNLFIADGNNNRIRKVDRNGVITTVAGNGSWGYGGDGGPAIEASLNWPAAVALDSAGNLYISDYGNNRIRKVDANGIITTIAGNGDYGFGGDGGPAVNASLSTPTGLAFDSAGNLYIADNWNYRIRKIDKSGVVTTVAGNGTRSYSGDGGPAVNAGFELWNIAADAAGNVYIADYRDSRIRKVNTVCIMTTAAGNGTPGFSGDGGPAVSAALRYPHGLALDPSGKLYIADTVNNRIRKVDFPSAFANMQTVGDILFADESGEGYVMSSAGLHKWTIDLNAGIVLKEFGYDAGNRLIYISDRFGNRTTINRDGSGKVLSITSPEGITTSLSVDSAGRLSRITHADGGNHDFEYTSGGLMTAKIDPRGNRFEHVFDANGRVTNLIDQEGGNWNYSRTAYANGDIMITGNTAEGSVSTYLDHTYPTGAFASTITDPNGAQTQFTQSADGFAVNKDLSCGMSLNLKYEVDPWYKFRVVTEMTERAPSCLTRRTSMSRTYEDTNGDALPDRIIEAATRNGKTTFFYQDTLQAGKSVVSPMGRTVTSFYDPANLLTRQTSVPGLFDTFYGYDGKGRLTSLTTNARTTFFNYNSQGFLSSFVDPESRTTGYSYDPVGRVAQISRPDGSALSFVYDSAGNMTVLTNPSGISHGFGYNRVNRNNSYQTPLSGSYGYHYDRDRRLVQTIFPLGRQIVNTYDKTRLTQISAPEGSVNFHYSCGDRVDSITKGTDTISYTYDGSLVASESISGNLNQTLQYGYNDDFNLQSFTYAGVASGYGYDNDGYLIQSGPFVISRNIVNGLPEAVSGGAINISRTFSGYGEIDGEGYNVGGGSIASFLLTRNRSGRITGKLETVDGITGNYEYSYDPMGRLTSVVKDGSVIEQYQYNTNGARAYEMNVLRGILGRVLSYSVEDHLLTAEGIAYQYDVDGFLIRRTQGGSTATYTYSSRGELMNATLPNGRYVEYAYDPLGRRITKKVNGITVEKYLWQGQTRLLAVYDGSDNLMMRFEYADARTPVSATIGGRIYYLACDQVGSLRVIADSSGNVIKRIDYDSFGTIITDTNPSFSMPIGFAGGLHDRDTNLVRFGYRDYSPEIGRWTAKDPIFFAGGDSDLYGYVLNDPVNAIDPNGKAAFWYHFIDGYRVARQGKGILDSLAFGWATMMPDFNGYKDVPEIHATTGSLGVTPQAAINDSLALTAVAWSGSSEAQAIAVHIWRDVESHAGRYFPIDAGIFDYAWHIIKNDLLPGGPFADFIGSRINGCGKK